MRTRMLIAVAALAAAAFAVGGGAPVFAHHSHAMFDGSVETELTGTLTRVRFANPHVYLQVEATHRDGEPLDPPQTWAIEMSTTQNMTNRGMGRDVFKVGSSISVKVNPLFSGGLSGNYTNVVMMDGVRNTAADGDWVPEGTAAR